jgi:exonuclease SbcC
MRPVRLDLDGFASFRDRAVVDFTDAEYFALVGPTGSGKSTVVDALTFALYGSAPRWGSTTSIQYALAPTANRCTVRLIFDVAGQRYVVAREVRRSGAQISQKNTTLERFLDPAATGDPVTDEATEVLADNPRSIRDEVADLLGLELAEFCTCVVLPQGEFQMFLKASVTERQNILLKLLGARHYDAIGKLAGRRAADATARVEALTTQLGEYADATEQHEAAARAREAELTTLQATVDNSVAAITAGAVARTETGAKAARTAAEIELLDGVCAPEGLVELRAGAESAERAYQDASAREREAGATAAAAEAALAAGPDRRWLEETVRWRDEWSDAAARRPVVEQLADAAAAARTTATEQATLAEGVLDEARSKHREATADRDVAAKARAALVARIDALRDVRPPDGMAELGERTGAAAAARGEAARAKQIADAELADAQTTLNELPERSAVDGLRRAAEAYRATTARIAALDAKRQELAAAVDVARAVVTTRTTDRDDARAALDELRTRSAAADLRPHLRVGDACPVCEQTVATLPPRATAPLLDAARTARADAEESLARAREEQHELTAGLAAVSAQLAETTESAAALDQTLATALPENPAGPDRDPALDLAAHDVRVRERETATERQRTTLVAADRARASLESTEEICAALAHEAVQGWAELHTTRGRLVSDGAPAVISADLAAAWDALTGWTSSLAERLAAAELAAADETLAAAEGAAQVAAENLVRAVEAHRRAAEGLTTAAVEEQRASSDRQRLHSRLAELDRLLADRPDPTQTQRLLVERDRLESAAHQARATAHESAAARQAAEEVRDGVRVEQQRARTAFNAAREPLIGLGAPPVGGSDLAEDWDRLAAWARDAVEQRRATSAELQARLAELGDQLRAGVAELAGLLAQYALEPAAGLADLEPDHPNLAAMAGRIASLVLVEREAARGRTREIGRRRTVADKLRATIAKDTEIQQVSAELQRLMGSRRFPQWLADAALDTLVADASASLMRLSNNQFDLTHERGEFFVVDHADADSRRSVRTLSGGETFQASLALALALSEQLSTLAAGGRTTLDSIFLDEGFGTLDPDALEIVAGTLENLAQEDRMVGVITHVSALAERVPVRYDVSRDSRTSSIVRVGP